MKYLKAAIIASFLLGFTQVLKSQSVLSASGGIAIGQEGTVSYTVGQVNYLTVSSVEGEIFQGVQIPFEITVITGIENPYLSVKWHVYPNPAGDFITMQTGGYDFQKLYYQFYDITGNLLLDGKATGDQSRINLGNLKAGTYFLRISDNIKNLKTFKIIKN